MAVSGLCRPQMATGSCQRVLKPVSGVALQVRWRPRWREAAGRTPAQGSLCDSCGDSRRKLPVGLREPRTFCSACEMRKLGRALDQN